MISKIYNRVRLKTNIAKIQELYGIQFHRAKMINNLLDDHLSYGYSEKIVRRAKNEGRITYSQWVRSVKSLIKVDLQILNLLIELAKENKAAKEFEKRRLQKLIT